MVAVLTVFANHLWDWPRGGFVGVDVFFVISGYLITSNLLRAAERQEAAGKFFRNFYWNRIRRIVPAATVVLILTCVAAILVFLPFRAKAVGIDAVWAFVFASNWWFGYQGTDYFRAAADSVSPLQHYWSLSIEEQFYFVWPALIFVISVVVMRKAWTHAHRMRLAGYVMAGIVALSLGWALYQTVTNAAWAYFDTFSRVWELGTGALLACTVGALARIPEPVRPYLSWSGLSLIAASLYFISGDSAGFPAPWALLPVLGAVLVIAAGVEGEPRYQAFLRNPVSGYIGDISYSLYLVHWPVIVLLGALMDSSLYYSLAIIGLGFGLAIASYHFVENPLRRATWGKFRAELHEIRRRRFTVEPSTQFAGLGALILVVVALVAYALPSKVDPHATPPQLAAAAPARIDPSGQQPEIGPLTTELGRQIAEALKAEAWPALDPTMEAVIKDDSGVSQPGIPGCGGTELQSACSWGEDNAPTKVVIGGNSVGVYYVAPLREIALNSGGQIQIHTEAMPGCNFIEEPIYTADPTYAAACPGRKQQFIDYVNRTKPAVVVLSHNYVDKKVVGTDHELTADEWATSMRTFIDKFKGSTDKVVILAAPPGDVQIADCYGKRGSVPADCIGDVTGDWLEMAQAERAMVEGIDGAWIDSRPWFCTPDMYCPSFVGSTPTKLDRSHMLPAYGIKIAPVIKESFTEAGVFVPAPPG